MPATDVQVFEQHADRRGDAGWRGRAGRRRRHHANGPSAPTQTFVYDPLAAPVLTCDLHQQRPGRRWRGGRLGAAVRLQPGRPDRRRARSGQRPADQRPGVRRADASARPLHALPGRGRHRLVLRHARRRSPTRRVTPARVLFRFLTETGAGRSAAFLVVPAQSRRTIDAAAARRAWRRPTSRPSSSRTCRSWSIARCAGIRSRGSARTPSRARRRRRSTWYLAEGATHGAFDLFYLLQNPSPTQTAQVQHPLPAALGRPDRAGRSTSRRTRARPSTSTSSPGSAPSTSRRSITSLNGVPIIVERAMYSSAAGTFAAGHDSAGVTSPSLDWFFAEGATGGFFDTFLLLANPNALARPTSTRPTCCRRGRPSRRTTSCPPTAAAPSTCSSRTRSCPPPRSRRG